MKLNQHTPGPWRWEITRMVNATGEVIFDASNNPCGPLEADAQLMAAAPDLLMAVKALREGAYGNPGYPKENDAIDDIADAAIAKAEMTLEDRYAIQPFRVVCSWCEKVMQEGAPEAMTSHSICEACDEKMKAEELAINPLPRV